MTLRVQLTKRLRALIAGPWRSEHTVGRRVRGPVTHIIILDGTMSSLDNGQETNAGLTYKLLCEETADVSVFYEAGVQWRDWGGFWDVLTGRGINRQIRRAYGYLASRYQLGDRIILMGYSRGAYAVRSLAGVIDRVGLLRPNDANVRNIRTAYRHYQRDSHGPYAVMFRHRFCHPKVEIEMLGVWDTVKALGLRLPILWRLTENRHDFHSHHLGLSVRHGFHALAYDETRLVYQPILWDCPPNWPAQVEQLWFRGTHGDVGGQLGDCDAARPLANIPLVWMLAKLETCGVHLPDGWRGRFPQDVTAPSTGQWQGWSRLFWLRRRRIVGQDQTEKLHDSLSASPEFMSDDIAQSHGFDL
jgi:uncharacterized protein (DUF2235 family)